MAIRKITGKPGSGKTYLAVYHLLKTYFTYDKTLKQFLRKKDTQSTVIITNIEGLLLPHINLNRLISHLNKDAESFFSNSFQEKLHKKYKHIIYLIDECQRIFHRKLYNTDVFYYFEYHRHYGDDIYLISPDATKICKDIGIMAEYELHALPRSISLAGEFKYKQLVDGEQVDTKVIKPNIQIYQLYKSQFAKEKEKIKRPFLKYILIPLGLFPIMAYLTISMVHPNKAKALASRENDQKKEYYQIDKKLNKNTHNQAPEIKRYIKLNGTIEINGELRFIIDPENNELRPLALFRYPIKRAGSTYYAVVPETYKTYDQSALDAAKAGGQGGAAEWVKEGR